MVSEVRAALDKLYLNSRRRRLKADEGAPQTHLLHTENPSAPLAVADNDKIKRDYWIDAWLEEYKAMREETTLAMTAQQHILQWSLAGLSALFAGGLVYLNGYAGDPSAVHLTICLLNFGVTIPGVAFCSQLAWWGEVLRMERSGIHLRGMERYLDRHLSASSPFDDSLPPLRFNMAISFGTYRKIKQGYLGALGIYVGVFTLSNLIYLVLLSEYGSRLQWVPYFKLIAMTYPVVAVFAILAYGGYLSLLFYRRSLMVADMSGRMPWPEDQR